MAMKDILVLTLIVLMAQRGYTRKLPDDDSSSSETSDILERSSYPDTQQKQLHGHGYRDPEGPPPPDTHQKLKALRNYLLQGQDYWDPTGPETSRQLRGKKFKDAVTRAKSMIKGKKKDIPIDPNNQLENDSADTVDSSILSSDNEDSSSKDSKIPNYLIDVGLGYFRKNFDDSIEVPITSFTVRGLHKIQLVENPTPSFPLDEWSATFKFSLILPLTVKFGCEIPYKRIASVSVKLQQFPDPIFEVNELSLSSLSPVDDDNYIKKCLKNKLDAKYVEEKVKDMINEYLTSIFTMMQEYGDYDPQKL